MPRAVVTPGRRGPASLGPERVQIPLIHGHPATDQAIRRLPARAQGARRADRGAQEVLRRRGGRRRGADRLLGVLLDLPAAAGVRDDPRLRPAGRPVGAALDHRLGARAVPGARRASRRAARQRGGPGDRPRRRAAVRAGSDAGRPEGVQPRLRGAAQGAAGLPRRAAARPEGAGRRRPAPGRVERRGGAGQRRLRRRGHGGRGARGVAGAEPRAVPRGLPAADRRLGPDRRALGRHRPRGRRLDDPAERRRPLRRPRGQGLDGHLRDVRHRDRPARVAVPRRADRRLRRGDQRRGQARGCGRARSSIPRRRPIAGPARRWPRWRSATTGRRSTSRSGGLRTASRAPGRTPPGDHAPRGGSSG